MKNLLKLHIDEWRIYGLDILRAFAILFVMLEHGQTYLPAVLKDYSKFIGFDGVSIFFVLWLPGTRKFGATRLIRNRYKRARTA